MLCVVSVCLGGVPVLGHAVCLSVCAWWGVLYVVCICMSGGLVVMCVCEVCGGCAVL